MKIGTLVLATKWSDGDPRDQFCTGYYNGSFNKGSPEIPFIRHLVVDEEGKDFRHNGFRRVARISEKRAAWIWRNIEMIEAHQRYKVWHWFRAPWKELNQWK